MILKSLTDKQIQDSIPFPVRIERDQYKHVSRVEMDTPKGLVILKQDGYSSWEIYGPTPPETVEKFTVEVVRPDGFSKKTTVSTQAEADGIKAEEIGATVTITKIEVEKE